MQGKVSSRRKRTVDCSNHQFKKRPLISSVRSLSLDSNYGQRCLFVLSHSVILRVEIWFLSGVHTEHSECHRQRQAQFSVLFVAGKPIGDKVRRRQNLRKSKPTKNKPGVKEKLKYKGNDNEREREKRHNGGIYVGT